MEKCKWYGPPLILLILVSITYPWLGNVDAQGNSTDSQSIMLSGSIVSSYMLKLHVEGTRIVDTIGNEVKLIGFNVHGKWNDFRRGIDAWNCIPPPPGVTIGEPGDDLLWMKAKGFNCVRAIMYWEYMEPIKGVYDETFFSYLDEFINACQDNGLYVLLDMHHDLYSSYFPAGEVSGHGFPHWAVDSYPNTTSGSHDFALDFFLNREVAAAARSEFVKMWTYIAERYGNNPAVMGYELLNEPWAVPNMTSAEGDAIVPAYCDFFNNEVGPSIRTVDNATIIAYPSYGYLPSLKKQTVSNVIWVQTLYDFSYKEKMFGFPDPNAQVYDPVVDGPKVYSLLINYRDKIVNEFGAPFMISEIGGDMSQPCNLLWLNDTLTSLSDIFRNNVSWLVWFYGAIATNNEPWEPRYNWGNPPIKDMPMVAILENHL